MSALNGTRSVHAHVWLTSAAWSDTGATLVGGGRVCQLYYFHVLFPIVFCQGLYSITHLERLTLVVAVSWRTNHQNLNTYAMVSWHKFHITWFQLHL